MKPLMSMLPAERGSDLILTRRERLRTCSSDSGCDVHLEPLDVHSTSLEDSVKRWQARLERVVQRASKLGTDIEEIVLGEHKIRRVISHLRFLTLLA